MSSVARKLIEVARCTGCHWLSLTDSLSGVAAVADDEGVAVKD